MHVTPLRGGYVPLTTVLFFKHGDETKYDDEARNGSLG